MVLDDLVDTFEPNIRHRGAAYFRSGAVRIAKTSPDRVLAIVQGAEPYRTELAVRVGQLSLSCSCPFFASYGPCKHLWATILAADARRALGGMPPLEGIHLERALDGSDVEPEAAPKAALPAPPAAYRRALPPVKKERPPPPPPWKELLLHARSAGVSGPAERLSWTGSLLYVVDVERAYGSCLTFSLLERERKKNGEWSKARPPRIPVGAIGNLDDALDRKILPLILGASAMADGPLSHSSYGFGLHRTLPPQLSVPVTMASVLMPLVSESGRLYVRATRNEDLVPARYDDGDPWEFVLCLRRRADGASAEVSGDLRRNQTTMSLSEPLLLSRDGWMVLADSVGRFEHFGAMGLVTLLRKQKVVDVPAAQEQSFLADLMEQPGLPRLDLPDELALREIAVRPRPTLRIERAPQNERAGPTSTARMSARLSFDYEGHDVPASDTRPVLARVRDGLLIRRHREAEGDALVRLTQVGFRAGHRRYDSLAEQSRFDVAPKKLPAAVRALTSEGWHVEAEGMAYRTASQFSLSVSSGIDWFDLSATADFGGVTAALPELLRALSRGESTVVLDDGTLGLLPEEWLAKHALLGSMGAVNGDKLRFGRRQAGLLDALLAVESAVEVDSVFKKAREELGRFAGVVPEPAPRGFKGELRPYQEVGLGWMTFLRRFGFGGCLADDMGLGKTVQVLAMLESRRRASKAGAKRPSLAVVPKSLVWNWRQEAARFTPRLKVLAHVGPERSTNAAAFRDADLALTTYGTMRADITLLREIEFDTVILDEAQAIKNASSESAKAARLLRGEHRLALSGTPIENHVGELWSLFEFLNPGMLGAATAFEGVTRRGRPAPQTVELLSRALRPFILRRTKELVAPELPPKHEETILCELDPPQRALYDELRAHYRASLLGKLGPGDDALGRSKILVLEALLRLRQASCHPGLIDKRRASEPSAKLDVLLARLEEIRAEGHKALVFSQFTSFLAILRKRLDASKVRYQYLDGDVEDRAARVARFQEDAAQSLFLISLKAGGVGLNLTAADYVFILDPWWNPAVEAQAVDRAHRIGQSKRVFVYRLLCRDTVEEKVAALQEAKRGLAESIIGNTQSLIRDLDRETLEMLLS